MTAGEVRALELALDAWRRKLELKFQREGRGERLRLRTYDNHCQALLFFAVPANPAGSR